MAVATSITFRNDNPSTIWNTLARKLGRDPTNAEASAEVRRILEQSTLEWAEAGTLPHQRGVLTW